METRNDTGTAVGRAARVFAWVVAIPFFLASLITVLLEMNITASPPRETAGNDLFEGTLEFFRNETLRWPQEFTSVLLFSVGFLGLIAFIWILQKAVAPGDVWMTLGALAIGTGAAFGTIGQLIYIGAKQIAIDPHYCDCERAVEQIIARGQALQMVDNIQRWVLLAFLTLAAVGLILIWRIAGERTLFSRSGRAVTLALASVLLLAGIMLVTRQDLWSGVLSAMGAGVLTPIWIVPLSRKLT